MLKCDVQERFKHYELHKLIAKGAVGQIFTTKNPDRIVKAVNKKNPHAVCDFLMSQYALNFPNTALCPVYDVKEEAGFYLIWKKKLHCTTTSPNHQPQLALLSGYCGIEMNILLQAAADLFDFGRIIAFKSNNFQEEADKFYTAETGKKALEKLQHLEKVEPFQHIAVFLENLLNQGLIIQDLRIENLGINIIETRPVLCILDGMMLTLQHEFEQPEDAH
jgi:hypothetical protein